VRAGVSSYNTAHDVARLLTSVRALAHAD